MALRARGTLSSAATARSAQALVHVFFAEREARRIPGICRAVQPLPLRSAAVIGAGTMGGGIAMSFANAGIPVAVLEASARGARARPRAGTQELRRLGDARQPAARACRAALALIRGRQRLRGARRGRHRHRGGVRGSQGEAAGVRAARPVGRTRAPSSPPTPRRSTSTRIAASTSRPEQVVGTHFFSPAHVMKLLENVRGAAHARRRRSRPSWRSADARQGRGARRQLRRLHRQPHAHVLRRRRRSSCWRRARPPSRSIGSWRASASPWGRWRCAISPATMSAC